MLLVAASATQPSVKIGFANPLTNGGAFVTYVNATMDSFKMVFDVVNANGGIPNLDGTPSGRMIEIVPLDNQGNTSHGPVVLADAMQGNHSDIVVLLLAFASRYTVPLEPVLAQHNLSIIGPITGESLYYNTYDPRFINLVPSADSEVLGLLRFLVVRKKLKRVALMQPYNLAYGQSQKEFAVKLLKELDMELVDIFWLDHPTLTFYGELGELLAAKPQGLLFYGPLSTSSATALGVLLQASSTLVIAVPVATSALLDSVLQAVPSSLVNDRLYAGSYAPHHRDTSYEVVRNFLATAGSTPGLYYPLPAIKAYDVVGSLSFIAYLHARYLVEVLRRNVNVTDRNQFRANLLDSTIISIDDIFYGVYSGTCKGSRVSLCECNNGAHSVFFNKIETNRSYTALPQETVHTPIESCREENLKIPSPLLQLQVVDSDGGITTDLLQLQSESDIGSAAAYGLVPSALLAAANSVVDSSVKYPVLDHVTRSSDSEVSNPVLTLANDYTLTVIAGSLTKYGVQNTSAMRLQGTNSTPLNVATVDDLTLIPYRSTTFESHTIRITSTMEQDIHALASYAAAASLQVGLLSSASIPDASYFVESLRRSAVTFGTAVGVTDTVSTSSAQTENPVSHKLRSLSTSGVLLVLGLQFSVSGTVANLDDAANAVGDFLNANSEGRVALPLSGLMTLYSHLVALLSQTQLQRVLVATNLPRWGSPRFNSTESNATDFDPSSLSETSTYFTTVPSSSRSPTVMWHFITQKFINSVVERVSGALTSSTLLSSVYLISSFVVEEGLTVGPFYNKVCGMNEVAGLDSCETNAGARLVFVHTLAGAMSATSAASDPSVKPVYQLKLPNAAIEYTTPFEQTSSLPTTVIAVACVVGGVLLIVLLGGLIFSLCCIGRRNAAAPKDETKPFTIVFTDIQSSTSLWAEVPEVMAPSLDLHHSAIRSLISKYTGYEVKTIGDSFMVAFASPTNALKFGLTLQQVFYSEIKWPGNGALDTMYIQFDETRIGTLRDTPSELNKQDIAKLSIELDPETYRSAWNGLRVRVGLHCGFGEIKMDEVSGGYDYYGSVVNAAARVESVAHGGQVVATKDVIDAITQDGHIDALGTELADGESPTSTSGLVFFSLGMVPLRGVPQPIELFQFCHFQHRQFPSLRIDHVGVLDEDGMDNDVVLDDLISLTSAPSGRVDGPVLLDASQLGMSFTGGISPRKMSDTTNTESSEDKGKQGHTKRIARLVRSGNTYLETLLSALPVPARESMIKILCEKWRIRLVSRDKFVPMHTARLQKVRDTMAPRKGSDTASVGSRHSVNEAHMKKLQKYLDDNADVDGAFKSYQLQAISKRIAPVVAAKEDKLKSKPADNSPHQVFGSVNQAGDQAASTNPSTSGGILNLGLDYTAFSGSRLGASGVSGLGRSRDVYNPYSPSSSDVNEGSVRVPNGDPQQIPTYMRPVGGE